MKDTYPTHSPQWWFDNYLPEPYRGEAIESCDPDYWNYDSTQPDLASAIRCSFNWTKSGNEGDGEYWGNLYSRARQGEFSKPQP
jgi:hypothetical protein